MLCSPTPVGPVDQAIQSTDAAPSLKLGRGLTTLRISRLNARPQHSLSTPRRQGHPWPTQDSLPAAGQLYRTGLVTRRIPSKGFWYASLHIILPSQVLRDAKLVSWVNQIAG